MADSDGDQTNRSTSTASCSKSISETVNGSHVFLIKGYSLAKGMGVGRYLSSDTFSVGGYDWAVYFYPDGKNPEDHSGYVSVFIALASDGNDVRALFKLEMKDQNGSGKDKVHSHFDRVPESGPYALKCRGSMWGYKRFYRRNHLEASNYLKDDCLEFHCTVGVVRNRVEFPQQCSVTVPPSNIGHSFKDLLDNEFNCDIVLQVGNETFKGHKLILAARSPVFRAHFFGLVGDVNMDTLVLEDMEPSIFKAMLQFIYTDGLPDTEDVLGSASSSSSAIMVQHLLAAADRFCLDRLKLLCEAKLCTELAVENLATTLSLAEQHRCQQLKTFCLKFASDNLGEVMQTEGFKHLEASCPALLSELLEVVASMDDNTGLPLRRKRSFSSIVGIDLPLDLSSGGSAERNRGRGVRPRWI